MKKFYFLIIVSLAFYSCTKSIEDMKLESDRLFNQALDYYDRGYLSQASDLFAKVIKLENKLGNEQRKANCYIYLGLINYQISDFSKAQNYYKEAYKIFNNLNDKKNELLVLNNIAGIHSVLGQYEEATKIYSDIIGKSLIFADKESEAIASLNLGELYQELWDFEKSFDYFNRAFDAYEILGDTKGMIFTLNKIGELFITSRNFPNALKSFDMAFEILNKTGLRYLNQEIYNNIGLIYFYENQISKAKEFFETAFNSITPAESNQHILISIKNNLGDCEYHNQSYSKALNYYKEALTISENSFLKFLSPVLQLKIAKSYEQLYLLNKNESDKKSAERFYEFALNRFEENHDYENLQKALTYIASFYHKMGEGQKSYKYFSKLKELVFFIELKPDDNLKTFAIKLDYDLSFIPSVINQQKSDELFNFLQNLKFQETLEHFLRFRDHNFLDEQHSKLIHDLKKEILTQNTYQRIFTQEISLPSGQRIKEKVKVSEKELEESSKKLDDLLQKVRSSFGFLSSVGDGKSFGDLAISSDKVFVELIPAGDFIIAFFVNKNGIVGRTIKIDLENLRFNLKILTKNLDEFDQNELKEFSSINFGQIADELISNVLSLNSKTKEIIFLTNGSELDLLSHLFFSKKYARFIAEKFIVGYSLFISDDLKDQKIKSIGILKNGMLSTSTTKSSELQKIVSPKSEQEELQRKRKIRIGFREEIKSNKEETIETTANNFDCVVSLDNLVFNSSSPELSYFESQRKFYLRDLLNARPKYVLLKSVKYEETVTLHLLLSSLSYAGVKVIILPMTKKAQENADNFLYNYSKRVENKNLIEASEEFFVSMREGFKGFYNFSLYWLRFNN